MSDSDMDLDMSQQPNEPSEYYPTLSDAPGTGVARQRDPRSSTALRTALIVLGAIVLAIAIAAVFTVRHYSYSSGQREAERLGYESLGSVTFTDFATDERFIDIEPGAPSVSTVVWAGDASERVLGALRSHDYECEVLDTNDSYWNCTGTTPSGAQVYASFRYETSTTSPYVDDFQPSTTLNLSIRA